MVDPSFIALTESTRMTTQASIAMNECTKTTITISLSDQEIHVTDQASDEEHQIQELTKEEEATIGAGLMKKFQRRFVKTSKDPTNQTSKSNVWNKLKMSNKILCVLKNEQKSKSKFKSESITSSQTSLLALPINLCHGLELDGPKVW